MEQDLDDVEITCVFWAYIEVTDKTKVFTKALYSGGQELKLKHFYEWLDMATDMATDRVKKESGLDSIVVNCGLVE